MPIDRLSGDFAAAAWDDLLTRASPAILPFLDFTWRQGVGAPQLPAAVERVLTDARRRAAVSELGRRPALNAMLGGLAAQSIDAVLLKGAALAVSVYPEPCLRPMADIDVWVREHQVDEAVACLLRAGFEIAPGSMPDGRLSASGSQRRLRHAGSRVRIELHGGVHSLQQLSPETLERIWQGAETIAIAGRPARILCPGDALVHACLHLGSTNRFADGQLPLLDVALISVTRGSRIDWLRLARSARAEKIAVYLTVALTLARDLFGASVPDEYFAAVGDMPGLRQIEDLARQQVWQLSPALPPGLERAFREPTPRARFNAMVARVLGARSPEARDGGLGAARTSGRESLVRDLTVKLPRYVRAWASGALGANELRRRARLAVQRGRIGELAERAEAKLDRE
jgi:hypothetical protein